MFCLLFSLQNKSFLCLQHVENKGFQTVIRHRLKAIQKHIKNELGNREKKHKKCTFRFEKMHISFSRLYIALKKYILHSENFLSTVRLCLLTLVSAVTTVRMWQPLTKLTVASHQW